MSTSLHRLPEVCARVGLRPTKIYEMVALKEFPAPIALGARARAWVSDDVDEWIAQRIAASRAATWRIVVGCDDPETLDFSVCAGLSVIVGALDQLRLKAIARPVSRYLPRRIVVVDYSLPMISTVVS